MLDVQTPEFCSRDESPTRHSVLPSSPVPHLDAMKSLRSFRYGGVCVMTPCSRCLADAGRCSVKGAIGAQLAGKVHCRTILKLYRQFSTGARRSCPRTMFSQF
eukprot:35655-Rhodomonas_salina.2